jgi:hypothetical protein
MTTHLPEIEPFALERCNCPKCYCPNVVVEGIGMCDACYGGEHKHPKPTDDLVTILDGAAGVIASLPHKQRAYQFVVLLENLEDHLPAAECKDILETLRADITERLQRGEW